MYIKMHNVGFGDCFTLSNQNHHLIVDCGTVNYKFNRQIPNTFKDFVNQYILQDINLHQTDEYSALITHFHKDHYLGFKHMNNEFNQRNIFSCLYVPFLLVKDSASSNYFLLDQIICSYLIYVDSSYYYEFANNALNHIKDLAPLAKNNTIRPLCHGQSFNIHNKRFEVLWPDPTYSYLYAISKDSSYDNIEIIREALQAIDRSSNFKNTTEIIEKTKKQLVELFNNWYASYNQDGSNIQKKLELIARMHEPLDTLLEIRKSINQDDISHFRRYSSLGKYLIKSANSTSIVFHDLDNKILMTGDITSTIIDNVLVNRFHSYYKYLKVPHHGTSNQHYSTKLPFSFNFLISSGFKSNYNPIGNCYYYHKWYLANRWCTAGKKHCEILKNGYTCINNSCSNDCVTLAF